MHFASRLQAGRALAARLTANYTDKNAAVITLDEGGQAVGTQIATQLRAELLSLQDVGVSDQLVGANGPINRTRLAGQIVIITSDGLKYVEDVDRIHDFLKHVEIAKLIFAVPFASIEAVHRLHVLADELHCLHVVQDYQTTDEYYDQA